MRTFRILSLALITSLAASPAFAQDTSTDTGKRFAVVGGYTHLDPKTDAAPGLKVDGDGAPTLSASLQRAQAAVARRQPGDAPYPEPAPVSAQRMRRSARPGTDATQADAALGTTAANEDPVAEVIARIARRIKPRAATNTPSTEQARRR